jgi:hypothetical protein
MMLVCPQMALMGADNGNSSVSWVNLPPSAFISVICG